MLVFRHAHHPEAGLQVPAGTVEEYEKDHLEVALEREIQEESGLTGLQLISQLATERVYSDYMQEWQERHFFHLEASDNLTEQWLHIVSGSGDDEGLHFIFFWVSLVEAAEMLIEGRGRWLDILIET